MCIPALCELNCQYKWEDSALNLSKKGKLQCFHIDLEVNTCILPVYRYEMCRYEKYAFLESEYVN